MRKPDYDRGRDDAFRWAVTWLHKRAGEMNDPAAKAILNSAAFHLGVETGRPKISPPSASALEELDPDERRVQEGEAW